MEERRIISIKLKGLRSEAFTRKEAKLLKSDEIELFKLDKTQDFINIFYKNQFNEVLDVLANFYTSKYEIYQVFADESYNNYITHRMDEVMVWDFLDKQKCLSNHIESDIYLAVDYVITYKNIKDESKIEEIHPVTICFNDIVSYANELLKTKADFFDEKTKEVLDIYAHFEYFANTKVIEFTPKKLFKKSYMKIEINKPKFLSMLETKVNDILKERDCEIRFLPLIYDFDKSKIVSDLYFANLNIRNPKKYEFPELNKEEIEVNKEIIAKLKDIFARENGKYIFEEFNGQRKSIPTVKDTSDYILDDPFDSSIRGSVFLIKK